MLRISIAEGRHQYRLIVEGKLVAPWAGELKTAYEKVNADLNGRELVVDMKGLTAITEDGENVLLELMTSGAKFHHCGVFTKQVLKRLACKIRRDVAERKR